MATQPTNLPVPSESPRDLKFNAGKIDEFVTSGNHVYVDRFGDEHRTIAGINYDANQAILNYGYITKKSFEDGSTLSLANECLRWESNGEYYRWDGPLPKVVPPGSTPDSTGGIGKGKWVSVGDASLRSDLAGPGGVDLVNGAAKQEDLDALSAHVDDVENSIYYSGKTAATHAKDMLAGTVKNIKFFGDSTMYGSEPPSLTQSVNNPPKMCKEALVNLYGVPVSPTITNYAIPGTTLYDMIRGTDGSGKTYQQRLTESACDIVYCNHGINDNQTGKDILQYRKDLITFVKVSRQYNATPILVTPNPQLTIGLGTTPNSKRFINFVNVMREVAANMAVDLVDNYKYMSQSLNVFTPITIFPDGVHMSATAYRQYGYNLAIPLVSAHRLAMKGDNAGLNGSTFYTNSTNSSIEEHGARCGETFIWTKESNATGINFPVIFEHGQERFGINELYWGSSAKHNYFINNVTAYISEPRKTYGSIGDIDWDGMTCIPKKVFAGLNVVGVLIDTATSIGTGATFSGVSLIGGSFNSITDQSGGYLADDYVLNMDAVALQYPFSSGSEVALLDTSGNANSKAISLKLTGTTLRLSYWANNAEVAGVDMSSSVTAGTYYTAIKLSGKDVIAVVGQLTARLSLGVDASKLKVDTKGQPFHVIRR